MWYESSEQRIKDIKEIAIAIDSWDDVFSDFDPRPLTDRTLSEDFLNELKRRYVESTPGNYSITIFAPLNMKDEKSEKIVISRLKKYFKYGANTKLKEMQMERFHGTLLCLFGFISLAIVTFTAASKLIPLTKDLIALFFEPIGWFSFWEGLCKVSDSRNPEGAFFERLAKADFKFKYVEDPAESESMGNANDVY